MGLDVRLISAEGPGGVAVLEVRGGRAEGALRGLMGGRALPAAGAMTLARLVAPGSGEVLDEALVLRPPSGAPLEVHLHGSPAIVREVAGALEPAPLPLTLEQRARSAAAAAPSEAGARLLLAQGDGRLRRAIDQVLGAGDPGPAARLLRTTLRLRRLLEPLTVVLLGPVNAGKSTLFNVLVGEDAAVVSDVPGTTRDARGRRAQVGPWPLILVDTAGARDLGDASSGHAAVEREGQALAIEAARTADLVLALERAGGPGSPVPPPAGVPAVRLVSRSPVAALDPERPAAAGEAPHIAALEHPEHARRVVAGAVMEVMGLPDLGGVDWPAEAPPFAFGPELLDPLERLAIDHRDPSALDALRSAL